MFFLTSEGKDEVTSSSSCVEKLGEQSPKKVRIRHSYIFYAFESYSVILELHVLLFSRLSRHCISVVSHVWPKKYFMFVYPPHIIPEREIEIAFHMNKVLDNRKNHQFGFSQNRGSVILTKNNSVSLEMRLHKIRPPLTLSVRSRVSSKGPTLSSWVSNVWPRCNVKYNGMSCIAPAQSYTSCHKIIRNP